MESVLKIGKHIGSALVGLFSLLMALIGIRTEVKNRRAIADDPKTTTQEEEPKV